MKKKKVIISICLVIVLSMSALVAVQATSGDENNIFEQLKALITGNTNRIEKLENKVDTLESEIDKLKGEITELQKPTEEEKATETEKKETTSSNTNKKPTANTTTKKPNTVTSSNTTKEPNSAVTTTTVDYQKQIDTLTKEIETLKNEDNKQTNEYKNQVNSLNTRIEELKKSIEELKKKGNSQATDIENLRTELNNKSEELKRLINSSSSSSNTNNTTISKADLIGTWEYGKYKYTFNADGTMTCVSPNYSTSGATSSSAVVTLAIDSYKIENYNYTLNGNLISITGKTIEYYTKIRLLNSSKEEIDLKKANELMGTNLSTEEELINYFDSASGGNRFSEFIKDNNKTEKLDVKNALRYDYTNGMLVLSMGQAMTKTK